MMQRILGTAPTPGDALYHLVDERGTLCGAVVYSYTGREQYHHTLARLCPVCDQLCDLPPVQSDILLTRQQAEWLAEGEEPGLYED